MDREHLHLGIQLIRGEKMLQVAKCMGSGGRRLVTKNGSNAKPVSWCRPPFTERLISGC